MRYAGVKFSEAEAQAIMAKARANLAHRNRDTENMRRHDSADSIVCKTTNNAAIPAPVPEFLPVQETTMDAQTASWAEWVDGRIEQKGDVILDAVGEVIGSERKDFQAALDRRDREIKSLRREIKMLRDEVGLERGLTALKAEVEEARRVQPHYEGKISVLEGKVAKLTQQTTRLRAGHTTLDYLQRQTTKRVTTTHFEVASVGAQTREVLERLRASGFDLMDEMQPSSELVS